MEKYGSQILVVLSVVILVLSIYLGFLFAELKKQKRKREESHAELSEREKKRDRGIFESLHIIALAVVQGQCEISEGGLRIYKLLSLVEKIEKKEEYALFDEFYEKIREFDFLEAREKLSNQEKFDQDSARFKVEEIYAERMKEVCQILVDHMKLYLT